MAAGLLAATAVSACGSTVQSTAAPAGPGGDAGDPALGTSATGDFGADGLTASPGPDRGGSTAGTPGDAGRTGSDAPALGGEQAAGSGGAASGAENPVVTGSGSAPPAIGVTDTTISIGFMYAKNASGRAAALGVESTPTSSQLILKALSDEINATGGLAGRKLVLVSHPFDEQSAEPYDQQMQQACTAWTEDNKVYAAVQAGAMVPNLIACLKARGVVALTAPATSNLGTTSFQRYPNYNEVTGANLDRLAALLATGHKEIGYYQAVDSRPVKVGLIRADDPDFARAAAVYRRTMTSIGLRVDDEVAIRASQSTGDAGRVLSEIQAAILRFKNNNITHLVFLLPDAGGTLFIMRAARDQDADFRFGLSSNDLPQFLSTQADITPQMLEGAMVTGWIPQTDVVLDKSFPKTAGRDRCEAIYRKHGVSFADQFAFAPGLSYCDSMLYLQTVLGTAKIPVTATTFAERSLALRSGFPSAFTFQAALEPNRRWGAQRWRGAAYIADCDCFRYIAPDRVFPQVS